MRMSDKADGIVSADLQFQQIVKYLPGKKKERFSVTTGNVDHQVKGRITKLYNKLQRSVQKQNLSTYHV